MPLAPICTDPSPLCLPCYPSCYPRCYCCCRHSTPDRLQGAVRGRLLHPSAVRQGGAVAAGPQRQAVQAAGAKPAQAAAQEAAAGVTRQAGRPSTHRLHVSGVQVFVCLKQCCLMPLYMPSNLHTNMYCNDTRCAILQAWASSCLQGQLATPSCRVACINATATAPSLPVTRLHSEAASSMSKARASQTRPMRRVYVQHADILCYVCLHYCVTLQCSDAADGMPKGRASQS